MRSLIAFRGAGFGDMRQKLLCGLLIVGVGSACLDGSRADDVAVWEVSPTPLVSIGEAEGDSVELFQWIVGVEVTEGGDLVVADGGLSVVRVFDRAGRFVAQMGAAGDGPGEFRSLRSIWMPDPGTIGVWDSRAARLTYYGLDGSLTRTIALERTEESNGYGTMDFLVGTLADDATLIATIGMSSADRTGRDLISVERFDGAGAHLGRVVATTGFQRDRLTESFTGPIAFSPRAFFAVFDGAIYHTTGARAEVLRVTGTITDTLFLPPLTHDRDAAWASLGAGLTELGLDVYDEALAEGTRPDSIPHLAGLMVDDTGLVWAKDFDPATDALWLAPLNGTGGIWSVVAPDGRVVARVAMPAQFRPYGVSRGSVVGVSTDGLGVQRVQVYAVRAAGD